MAITAPVNIIAIHHQNNGFTSALVKNLPFTDKGKIAWWLKNKDRFKENYGIPASDKDGFFEVIFWDFNDGYQETDGYDRLCFEDISPPLNCIEKKSYLRSPTTEKIIFILVSMMVNINLRGMKKW